MRVVGYALNAQIARVGHEVRPLRQQVAQILREGDLVARAGDAGEAHQRHGQIAHLLEPGVTIIVRHWRSFALIAFQESVSVFANWNYGIPMRIKEGPMASSGISIEPVLLPWRSLTRKTFIEVEQFDKLLAIATMIGMMLLGQSTKTLLDLHHPRIRWQA